MGVPARRLPTHTVPHDTHRCNRIGNCRTNARQRLEDHGYDVRIASRTPEKLAAFSQQSGIQAGTFADVASWAEAVILAVKGSAAEQAVRDANPANLRGQAGVGTTDPIADRPPEKRVR